MSLEYRTFLDQMACNCKIAAAEATTPLEEAHYRGMSKAYLSALESYVEIDNIKEKWEINLENTMASQSGQGDSNGAKDEEKK